MNYAFSVTVTALEGLDKATQSDQTFVANLTAANNKLTDQIRVVNDVKNMIFELAQEVKQLKHAMKNIKLNNANRNNTNNQTSVNGGNNNGGRHNNNGGNIFLNV